ncbi:hypothetical protein NUW54_g499 [Trametes sanguinea]|uniref:Uncharacterized protein n=1 Tax=Trametes sanguinea TaxID=158606 RepID=A0ACC1QAV7_9APHY|nr:hypothetical protein NUW54_g499 [Trametes sanguinea]
MQHCKDWVNAMQYVAFATVKVWKILRVRGWGLLGSALGDLAIVLALLMDPIHSGLLLEPVAPGCMSLNMCLQNAKQVSINMSKYAEHETRSEWNRGQWLATHFVLGNSNHGASMSWVRQGIQKKLLAHFAHQAAEDHEERKAKWLRNAKTAVATDDMVEVPEPLDPAMLSHASRVHKVPARLKEFPPSSLTGLPTHLCPEPVMVQRLPPPSCKDAAEEDVGPSGDAPPSIPSVYQTTPDQFDLYQVYTIKLQHDPCDIFSWENICDPVAFPTLASAATHLENLVPHRLDRVTAPPWAPSPNVTTFELVHWQNEGSNLKSHSQMNSLADVMQVPSFNPHDLTDFVSGWEAEQLDEYSEATKGSPFSGDDRWKDTSVQLYLPKEKVRYTSEDDAPEFPVPNVHHCSLVDLFWLNNSSAFPDDSRFSSSQDSESSSSDSSSEDSADVSLPFESCSHSSTSPRCQPAGVQVYFEAWHVDAWHDEDAEMRSKP